MSNTETIAPPRDGTDSYAAHTIRNEADLRALYGEPGKLAVGKELRHLDKHCVAFIGLSPFLMIGSTGADGLGDVSPRGDAPGFVRVLDANTLAIPDRMGNNRTDTLSNIVANPEIGLLFMVPGMNETLRVNGTARLVVEPALLESMIAQNKLPRSAIVVTVREAYLQCAKALIRSKLWTGDHAIDRKTFPTLGQIIADQMGGIDVTETEAAIQESVKTRLY